LEELVGDDTKELLHGVGLLELLAECPDLVDDGCELGSEIISRF
jgi:hypothetical protein